MIFSRVYVEKYYGPWLVTHNDRRMWVVFIQSHCIMFNISCLWVGGFSIFFLGDYKSFWFFFLEFKEKNRPILVRFWKRIAKISTPQDWKKKKKNTGEGKQIACTPFSMWFNLDFMDKLSSNPFESPWMIFLCTFIDEIWFTFM